MYTAKWLANLTNWSIVQYNKLKLLLETLECIAYQSSKLQE